MKFFPILPLSSFPEGSSAYLYDVQDIPEPSRQLYFPYSTLQNQLPKNGDPNTSFPTQEIPVEEALMNGPLVSSLEHLYLLMVDIRYAYEYDPYSQLPLIYGHSHYCKSGLTDRDICASNRLLEHDNDILSPKLYGKSNYLLYGNFCDIQPYNKSKHL
jgi:hypothetical protein